MSFGVTKTWVSGNPITPTDLNGNFDDIVPVVIVNGYSDITEDESTDGSWTTIKTYTITGGDFATDFWVYTYGYFFAGSTSIEAAEIRITVGGTEKGYVHIGLDAGTADRWQAWSIMIRIPAADADWTPGSNVDVDVDVQTTQSVYVKSLLIYGR